MTTGLIGSISSFSLSEDFENWYAIFENFLLANGIDHATKADQCRAILLSTIGMSTYTLLKDLVSPDSPE